MQVEQTKQSKTKISKTSEGGGVKKTSKKVETSKKIEQSVVEQTLEQVQEVKEPVVEQHVEVVEQTEDLLNNDKLLNIATEAVQHHQQHGEVLNFVENLNTTSDELAELSKFFKENTFSKDERSKVDISFKKLYKAFNLLQLAYMENLTRDVSRLEKSSGNKSNAVKKVQDKDKAAIHKKLNVYPFLLTFMKLEAGTQVSRSQALTAITQYVKNEKESNPSIIVDGDKKTFKLIGDLEPLFKGMEGIMRTKGLLKPDEEMPTQIKYTEIMHYMTYCFDK